jgi:hypothetical protein
VTHTVGSVGVLGAGEASSVARHAHPHSTDKTVLSSVGARMEVPATTYQESATALQDGQDLCKYCTQKLVRIIVISWLLCTHTLCNVPGTLFRGSV